MLKISKERYEIRNEIEVCSDTQNGGVVTTLIRKKKPQKLKYIKLQKLYIKIHIGIKKSLHTKKKKEKHSSLKLHKQ